jgi:hypothetical protein
MLKQQITAASLLLALTAGANSMAQETPQSWQDQWNSGVEFDILDAATWVAPLKSIPGLVVDGQAYDFNPWSPQTWTVESFLKPAPTPRFELSRPSGWVVFLKPESYAGMMNPATYSQFILPEFWTQFVNPVSYLSWMNPFEYTEFLNPLVYLQWANPLAYAPLMNPVNYASPANPVNYVSYVNPKAWLEWLNPSAYSLKGFMNAETAATDLLNPGSWTNTSVTTFDPFNPASWLANR